MLLSEAFAAFELDELLSEGRSHKTIDSYRSTCRSLLQAIGGDVDVALLMYAHIINWKRTMHDRANSGSHMAGQLMELRRVLTYLRSHGFTTLDPGEIKMPKYQNKETGWFNIEEVRRFLGAIDNPRDKALFGSMFDSGARISELLSINRGGIVNGRARIIGKGNTPGYLEFNNNSLMLIDNYLATRTDTLPPLFISRQNRRICVQQCIRLFHKYTDQAGLVLNGRGATHILRHSFGSNLELNGLDINGIANQMRHKKLETTKIYLHGKELKKVSDYQQFHTPVPLD